MTAEETNRYPWVHIGLLVLILSGAIAFGSHYEAAHQGPLDGLLDRPVGKAAVLFVVLFVLLTLAFAPATPLVVAAGVLFGGLWGTLLAWSAAMASATVAYAIGRFGGGPLRRLVASPVERLSTRIDLSDTSTIMLLRMVLIFPFPVVNYGLGLARVEPRRYLIGTMLGNLPWIVAFALLGAALGTFHVSDLSDPRFLVAFGGGSLAVLTLFAIGRMWAGRWSARRALETA